MCYSSFDVPITVARCMADYWNAAARALGAWARGSTPDVDWQSDGERLRRKHAHILAVWSGHSDISAIPSRAPSHGRDAVGPGEGPIERVP